MFAFENCYASYGNTFETFGAKLHWVQIITDYKLTLQRALLISIIWDILLVILLRTQNISLINFNIF